MTAYEFRIMDWISVVCSSDLSFPQQVVDALRDRKQITLITNGWRSHAHGSGWLTARLNNAPVSLSVEEGSSGGVITRIVIYPALKHFHHGRSTADMSSMPKTKEGGRRRLELLKSLVERMARLERSSPFSKPVLLSQYLRTEIKIMGRAPTNLSDWLMLGPPGGPKYVPNKSRFGRFFSEEFLSKMLGVDIQLSHVPVQRLVHSARAAIDKMDVIKGQREKLTKRSEEHTSELQTLMRNSDAGVCLKKKK